MSHLEYVLSKILNLSAIFRDNYEIDLVENDVCGPSDLYDRWRIAV